MHWELLVQQLDKVAVVVNSKKILVKLSHADSKIALCFNDFFLVHKMVRVLKKKFDARNTWRNYLMFYLPLFDDFLKIYKIEGKLYFFEPNGFSYSDGLAFWTDLENEEKFMKIIDVFKEKLGIIVERE